ncbi:MAG: NUDIX domain-containing protein [Actinobacteria bacterium]|nr:NUDIX domain-containing protein [Actinomycetota bacterium]
MIHPDFVRLHGDATTVLTAWRHPDAEQLALRDDYLAFLAEYPDAMSRECRTGHITASALVLDEDRTRVLLTLHPKVGRWLQLGGHCEIGDSSLRAAAIREAQEEGGIHDVTMSATPIQIDRHPVSCAGDMSVHYDVEYLALVPRDAQEVISDESDDLRWFALDALPDGLDNKVRSMIDAALVAD